MKVVCSMNQDEACDHCGVAGRHHDLACVPEDVARHQKISYALASRMWCCQSPISRETYVEPNAVVDIRVQRAAYAETCTSLVVGHYYWMECGSLAYVWRDPGNGIAVGVYAERNGLGMALGRWYTCGAHTQRYECRFVKPIGERHPGVFQRHLVDPLKGQKEQGDMADKLLEVGVGNYYWTADDSLAFVWRKYGDGTYIGIRYVEGVDSLGVWNADGSCRGSMAGKLVRYCGQQHPGKFYNGDVRVKALYTCDDDLIGMRIFGNNARYQITGQTEYGVETGSRFIGYADLAANWRHEDGTPCGKS